jgi:hypothetical protein
MNLILALLCATISPAYQPIQPCPAPSFDMNSGSLASLFRYTWLDSVSGPPDTIYTDTVLTLSGTAMFHASQNVESVLVAIQRWSPNGHWFKGQFISLAAGESVPIVWQYGEFEPESAYHVVRESIMDSLPGIPRQDSFITWRFWILRNPHGDVKEGIRQSVVVAKPKPSILRHMPADAVAFDAMGRRALNPKPGVYFLRGAPAALPRKVLLVE